MYKKIFFDANIIADVFDDQRTMHEFSLRVHAYIINNNIKLFTSCDIVTTVYYIESKHDKKKALDKIYDMSQTIKIIEFSNFEIDQTCILMKKDNDYKDLEDTIQYILAKKVDCDLIISNDKRFISKEIDLMSSKDFCDMISS